MSGLIDNKLLVATEQDKHHSTRRIAPKFFALILAGVVLLAVGALFAYRQYSELKAFRDERDTTVLLAKLGKILELPKEEPIIATVTDVEKLKTEQAFYRNAQNGDKLFVWKDKALIFRAETGKIIDFGIILASKDTEPTPSPSPQPTIQSTQQKK
jgi:hypothetical protein